jgi:hypothetical protein
MALRRWGRAMLPHEGNEPRPTAEMKLEAYNDRDDAKGKLDLHRESCPTCFKDFNILRKR